MKKPDLAWLNSAKEKLLPLLRRYRALLIVLLAGVLLLASGGLSGGGQPDKRPHRPMRKAETRDFPCPRLKRI